MEPSETNSKADEFGDFQTPSALARQVCDLLAARGLAPASIVEPSCGIGNVLLAALDAFPAVGVGLGVEINKDYHKIITNSLKSRRDGDKVRVVRESIFRIDWAALLRDLPEPILVIGNPPWITNARLGVLGSSNLPRKTNSRGLDGLAAMTGKSNFDISEWLLTTLLGRLEGRVATMAMLCKTAVARKVLAHGWKEGASLADAEIHPIDAAASFGASVDACLLVCSLSPSRRGQDCRVFSRLGDPQATGTIGLRDGQLIADVAVYDRWKHLGGESAYRWRSGVKHDCARVMELRKEGGRYRNGLGEMVELEDDYLYPMRKSSELANGRIEELDRWMLVTQRAVGEDTSIIRAQAPKTWDYLQKHGDRLDRRASSIYRGRPRFSIFGVGDYTFSPWKVAISGFYKRLQFVDIGSHAGRPIVLDDTAYFVPCQSEHEAREIAALLNSEAAREFFSAFIFWDAKRPITIEILRGLDLSTLGSELADRPR